MLYPPDKTWKGTVRHRQGGGGATGVVAQREDKRLFILGSEKPNPRQTRHGLPFALRQPQTHYGIPPLRPVLPRALAALEVAPERAARPGAPPAPPHVGGRPQLGH